MVKGKSLNAVRINYINIYIYDKNQQDNIITYFSIDTLNNSANKLVYVNRKYV